MTGRTHLAVGTAAALVACKPQNLKELTLCIGVAVIGSLICDIDVSTSKSHRTVEKVITLGIFAALLTAYMEYSWKIGLLSSFQTSSNGLRLLVGAAFFLLICGFGKEQPHRSFMHSFLALALLTGAVYVMYPEAAAYFAVAMCSHMVADTLNYMNVQLFYPIKGGISLNLCHAKGTVNTYIGYSALLIILLECVLFVQRYQ